MTDTVGDWIELVHGAYPPAQAADWDQVGLQVGDPDWPVERVLVSLDVTREVVAEAADGPATLLLAHHPLLFRPLQRLTPSTAAGASALAAARAGVAIAAAHTNLDVARDGAGTSDPVSRVLGLLDVEPLTDELRDAPVSKLVTLVRPEALDAVTEAGAGATVGFGNVGRLPEPRRLVDIATTLRTGLPAPHLRVAGVGDRLVERVAVVGGAGDGLIGAALAAGVDLYVTGDLRHHVTLDALEQGLALIDAGHHATEVAALPHWIERLTTLAGGVPLTSPVVASKVPTDPWRRA